MRADAEGRVHVRGAVRARCASGAELSAAVATALALRSVQETERNPVSRYKKFKP